MASILCREKELCKMNQELNLLALQPAEEDNRFGTYHKQKGPSTLLKKSKQTSASPKVRPLRSSATTPTPQTPPTPTLLSKAKVPDWRLGNDWKQGKAAHSKQKSSTFTRGVSHKTATATYVKYHNPNFTQSPSLDLLLRNEETTTTTTMQAVEVALPAQTRESTTVVSGQSKKQLTQDNFIRFLKAKVGILEEDHQQLSVEMSQQKERLEETIDALHKAETRRDQALSSNAKLSEQLQRLEQQAEELLCQQKQRQQEQSGQQREVELLRRENKLLKQTNNNLENRVARAQDETESVRQTLSQQQEALREQQTAQHKELKVRDQRIKALKRQRADLLNAYKKQLYMIDNLKRQTGCMEQAVAIGFGEKEFNKVLEWHTPS
ncbi:CG4681, partial [Drosophila busckii]